MGNDDEDDNWWRPPWQDDTEEEPPGRPKQRQPAAVADYAHPLLSPLALTQEAVTRLETRADTASPAVAEGLRARMSYREAAGWLGHAHIWIHPQDLALRDAGLTGSYGAAARLGRIEGMLPATVAQGADFSALASNLGVDTSVDMALRFARLWRRLAEFRTWRPLADAEAMQETLQSLGFRVMAADAGDWLASVHAHEEGPALIRTGRVARDWINRPGGSDPLTLDGMFLAACLWREKGFGRSVALPFWLAGEQRLHRLSLRSGLEWMAGFLDCVAAAARAGAGDLDRLQQAEERGRRLIGTARSRLQDAVQAMLRSPILTAGSLAKSLDVTPQAALGLLRQMLAAGLIREATGRASWRAFVLA